MDAKRSQTLSSNQMADTGCKLAGKQGDGMKYDRNIVQNVSTTPVMREVDHAPVKIVDTIIPEHDVRGLTTNWCGGKLNEDAVARRIQRRMKNKGKMKGHSQDMKFLQLIKKRPDLLDNARLWTDTTCDQHLYLADSDIQYRDYKRSSTLIADPLQDNSGITAIAMKLTAIGKDMTKLGEAKQSQMDSVTNALMEVNKLWYGADTKNAVRLAVVNERKMATQRYHHNKADNDDEIDDNADYETNYKIDTQADAEQSATDDNAEDAMNGKTEDDAEDSMNDGVEDEEDIDQNEMEHETKYNVDDKMDVQENDSSPNVEPAQEKASTMATLVRWHFELTLKGSPGQ